MVFDHFWKAALLSKCGVGERDQHEPHRASEKASGKKCAGWPSEGIPELWAGQVTVFVELGFQKGLC